MRHTIAGRFVITNECDEPDSDTAVVHACKTPCHQQAVGYTGSLAKDHANYLFIERDDELFLNIIDPPVPLFTFGTFERFLAFAYRNQHKTLIVHCNQGRSRSPSLVLLYMAHAGIIPNGSYAEAREAFTYPLYEPGKGIEKYLTDNWETLMKITGIEEK